MKKLILIAALILAIWNYFEEQKPKPENRSGLLVEFVQSVQGQVLRKPSKFSCDGRKYCTEMTSRAEAEYFLNFCPNAQLDDNNNGVPCEDDPRF